MKISIPFSANWPPASDQGQGAVPELLQSKNMTHLWFHHRLKRDESKDYHIFNLAQHKCITGWTEITEANNC